MRDRVSWSAQAESDLLEACGYLATGSAEVAERFLEAVDSTLDLLRSNPEAGCGSRPRRASRGFARGS